MPLSAQALPSPFRPRAGAAITEAGVPRTTYAAVRSLHGKLRGAQQGDIPSSGQAQDPRSRERPRIRGLRSTGTRSDSVSGPCEPASSAVGDPLGPRHWAASPGSPAPAAARLVPGKLLWKLDPAAVDALARAASAGLRARLRHERQDDDGGDGRRESSRRGCGSHTTAPARTSSPGSPRPCSPPATRSSASSRSTRRRCPRSLGGVRPRAVCLGNLFRDQLDRYGELERRRRALAGGCRSAARPTRRSSSTATTRRSETSAASAARTRTVFGRRRSASGAPGAPARRRLEVVHPLRHGLRVRGGLRRPPRRLPLPGLRPRPPAARRRRPRDRARAGSTASSFDLVTPDGSRRVQLPRARALQRLQRARRGRARARRSVPRSTRSRHGLEAFHAAFGPLRADRSSATRRLLMLLIKNPAGANEAIRTLRRRRRAGDCVRGRAQRRDRRRPRRVVDLGRRLRAAPRRRSSGSSSTGDRAAELALRFKYGGFDRAGDRGRAGARSAPRPRASS